MAVGSAVAALSFTSAEAEAEAATATATSPALGSSPLGADISWPNCKVGMGIPERRTQGNPMPTADTRFVVIGLTNGPGFSVNPCLTEQVAWAKARHLWTSAYSIVSYPTAAQLRTYGGSGTPEQRLARVGAAQASFNLTNMRRAGLPSPFVWVDVEPVRGWAWSTPANNNAFLNGVLNGYAAGHAKTGIYSYAYGWKEITGGRSVPNLPTWVPSGKDTVAAAAAKCGTKSFSGGPVVIGQSTVRGRDIDVLCSGVTGTSARPHELTKYLRIRLSIGSVGASVAVLQRHVGASPDGDFGRKTKAKVLAFQKAKHLRQNGIVDAAVWRALGAGTTVTSSASQMDSLFLRT